MERTQTYTNVTSVKQYAMSKIHNYLHCTFEKLKNWRKKQARNHFIGVFIGPLTAFGYWSEENNKYSRHSRCVRTFARIWLFILVPFFTVTCFVGAYVHRKVSVTDSLYCFLNGCVYLLFVVIVVVISTRGDLLKEAVVALETMLLDGSRLAEQPTKIMQQSKMAEEICVTLYYGVTAIFATTALGILGVGLSSRKFVYEIWVPYNITETPYFEMTSLAVNAAMFSGFQLVANVYSFILVLLAVAVGQFRLLNFNLLQLRHHQPSPWMRSRSQGVRGPEAALILPKENRPNHRLVGKHTSLETLALFSTNDVDERLGKCVLHHESILSFVSKIQPALDPILLNHLNFSVTPTILAIALMINTSDPGLVIYLTSIPLFGSLVYTWLLCWLSEEIATESEQVRDAVFSSDWLRSSASFRQSMRIMISMSNQPKVIKVGGFIPLSRQLFYAIIKLTYTWYMSLNEVQGKILNSVDKSQ